MKKLYIYNSLGELNRDITSAPFNKIFANMVGGPSSQHVDKRTKPWSGTKDWDTAENLMLSGDDESVKLIMDTDVIKTPKRTIAQMPINRTSVVGRRVHMPNFVAGLPNCMIRQKQIPYKQRVITIVVSGVVGADWTPRELAEVNAKVVTAIQAIERGGIYCNLFMLYAYAYKTESVGALIKIKDSGHPIEISKMAYAMVNPAMMRRHSFRFLETRKELKQSGWTFGYGHVCSESEGKKLLEDSNVEPHYFCHISSLQDLTPEEVKARFEEGNQ